MIFLLLFLVVLFSVPQVQTRLAKYITTSLNEDYKTNIKIEKVDLSFLGSANFKNVHIADHHNDTLINVKKLSASLLSLTKVFNNKLIFDDISLTDAKVYMKIHKGEDDDNMAIFIDKFDNGQPTDTLNPFILKAKNIRVYNLEYKYSDDNDAEPLQFSASNGNGDIHDFSLIGSDVELKTHDLAFIDNRGLDVKNLTSNITYTESELKFLNTTLETNDYSKIRGNLVFRNNKKSFSDFLNKVKIKAKLSRSKISATDLKKFYSGFSGEDNFSFNGYLSGTLNDLKISNFSLYSRQGMQAEGDMKFVNSFSAEKGFRFEGDFDEVVSNYEQLNELLPKVITKEHKQYFDKFGEFKFSGAFELTPKYMDTNFTLQTDIGNAISKVRLTNFHNLDNAKYKGNIKLIDFNLGKLIGDDNFGKVTLQSEINGKGFVLKNLNSKLKGKMQEFDFKGYTYKTIDVNGEIENRKFDGFLTIEDENVKLNFEGLADFSSKVHDFDFCADIEKLDLKKTNLFARDSIAEISGKINLDAKGNTFDDVVGKAVFENFLYTSHKKTYEFKKFEFNSKVKDSIRTMTVNSDEIIQGKLEGKFLFKELIPITQNALWSTYSNYEPISVQPNQYLKFDFKIYNEIVDIFLPKINIKKDARIKGKIDANRNSVKILAESSKITAYDVEMDSLELKIDNKRPLYHTHLKAKKVVSKFYQISKLNLINRTQNDTLYFKSAFKGGKKETENYSFDFFYTFNPQKQFVVGVQKSIFNVKGKDWIVNPNNDKNNKLSYDAKTDKFQFYPFLAISDDKQKMEFNGNIIGNTKELQAKFENIKLQSVIPEIEDLALEGELNGGLSLTDKKGVILPIGDIEIKDFVVNGTSQGTLKTKIKGNNSYEKYDVDFSIRDWKFDNVKVVGSLDFSRKKPAMDLNVKFREYELDGFSDFFGSAMSNIRGVVSGDFSAKGNVQNPDFDGLLNFEKTGLAFPYLNIDFDIVKKGKVRLKNQSFIFENTSIRDTKYKTRGVLFGKIFHHNFNDWHLDLGIKSKNLLVLDTQESEEEMYYGTAFFDGQAIVKGKTSNLTINVSGKTEKNTKFVIPLSDLTIANSYNRIKFVEKKNEDEVVKKYDNLGGLNLLMDLEITKDAVAEVVIDKINKSDLQGRGTGNLQIKINTNGSFNMFGDLLIDSGIYNFRYTGIPKKFEVLKGGTISWNGDPLKAELDLVAIYKARANPSKLLDNVMSNRKIPVNLYTKITGELFNSKQDFDIKIPNADSAITSELEFMFENDANSKMLNFASLLLGNTFYKDNLRGNFASNVATSTASDMLSSVLSDIINSNKSKIQLDFGYTQADKSNVEDVIYDDQVDMSFSGQLSDRVIFNGRLGIPLGNSNIQSSVVSEAKLEVLLNKAGTFRWNIFNKPNNIQYSIEEQGYTQGTGLSYQVGFNSFSDLLRKMGLKKKENNQNEEKQVGRKEED